MARQQYSCSTHALEVQIVADRTLEYTFSRYTEYAVGVSVGGVYVTSIWQRYKRFHQLHKELARKMGAQKARLPALPPKIRGQGAHPRVVAERREELCRYINSLLQSVPKTFGPLLDRFLGLDRASLPMPSPESGRTLRDSTSRTEYDHAEVERVQQIVGECDMLVEELSDELGQAGLPADEVARVELTATELVRMVQALAAGQHVQWHEALKAERERAAYLERSVRALAFQNEQVLAGSVTPVALREEEDDASGDSSSDDDDFFDTASHYDDDDFHDPDAFHETDAGRISPGGAAADANAARLARLDRIDGSGGGGGAGADALEGSTQGVDGRRRTRLSAYKGFVEVSMWGFLKEVIGQDLTRITFPVAFNEPLSLLQRAAEDMEYSHLLDQAAACADSEQKLLYVSAFAMSNYSATCGRLGKPFNPLLHETFEYTHPSNAETKTGGFRYLAEQVGHHPPVSAIHAEALPARSGAVPAWTFWSDWEPKMSLSGARCNVVADGVSQIRFAETGDHFSWSKVTTQVNGIIVGTMAITHFGEMKVVNHTTGETCVLDFESPGWFSGPDQGRITGAMRTQSGVARYALEGSWDVHAGNLCAASAAPAAAQVDGGGAEAGAAAAAAAGVEKVVMAPGEEPAELFRVAARPANSARQYNFTQFAIGLNQRPGPAWKDGGAVSLPAPTDTSLRPDVRAMEEGNIGLAADEKHRLETKQRAARAVRNDAGEHGEPPPRWFRRERDALLDRDAWVYQGEYWTAQEAGLFESEDEPQHGCDDLF